MGVVSYISSSHANSGTTLGTPLVIPNPSTTFGDLLIAGISHSNFAATTIVPPTGQGWTLIGGTQANTSLATFYRFVGASDPTSFSFASSISDATRGGIIALRGADPSAPIQASNFATVNVTAQTTASLTPTRLGCLPVAFFGINQPNTGASTVTGIAASWAESFVETYVTNNAANQYNAIEGQRGSPTADISTPIYATASWDGFSTPPGFASIILVQPGVPGPITINGNGPGATIPISFSAIGQSSTLTIAQSGSFAAITLAVSDISKASISVSSVNPPSATAVVTSLAPGTVSIIASGA